MGVQGNDECREVMASCSTEWRGRTLCSVRCAGMLRLDLQAEIVAFNQTLELHLPAVNSSCRSTPAHKASRQGVP